MFGRFSLTSSTYTISFLFTSWYFYTRLSSYPSFVTISDGQLFIYFSMCSMRMPTALL